MERRKFIAGVGSLAAGSAAAMGTGAFTSVSANRSVSVSTADDNDALLRFAQDGNDNSAYAEVSNGTVAVDLDDLSGAEDSEVEAGAAGDLGSGVNKNALTRIYDIFTIENQGTQPAIVYADPDSLKEDDAFDDSVDNLYVDPQFSDMPNDGDEKLGTLADGETKFGSLSGNGGSVDNFEEQLFESNTNVPYGPETFLLNPGQSFDFGLYVRTTGDVDSVDIDVDIKANAALADRISE